MSILLVHRHILILDVIGTTKVVSVDKYKKSGVRETVLDVLDREGMTLSNVVKHPSGIDIRNLEGTYASSLLLNRIHDMRHFFFLSIHHFE